MFKYLTFLLLISLTVGCSSRKDKKSADVREAATLTKVTEFNGGQVTGVTVSSEGRIFACFPRWRDYVPFSVVEVMPDGTHKPYPDDSWNSWTGAPSKNKFTRVQSV